MSATGTAAPILPLQAFLSELTLAQEWIAKFQLAFGPTEPPGDENRLNTLKQRANGELEKLRDAVSTASPGVAQDELAIKNARQAWRVVGRYRELVDRLDRHPFMIEPKREGTYVIDIGIKTRDAPIPPEAGQLKSDIDAAANVITTVFGERLKARPWHYSSTTWTDEIRKAQDYYLTQLLGIAKVGLEKPDPSRTAFARLDLLRLTNLFTLREAGAVKNAYVDRLFRWSGVATLLFFVLYGLARTRTGCEWAGGLEACKLVYDLRNLFLLAAGTAVGTWLSFSLRRQELTFSDLALLEPDRLNPATRIVFMIGLASLVGLLLFSGAVIAGVGNVDGLQGTHTHGSWALLLGLLAGVGERALGSAVSKRGLDFANVIGGTAPSATARV